MRKDFKQNKDYKKTQKKKFKEDNKSKNIMK